MTNSADDALKRLAGQVNVAFLLDHAGRAGNSFFLTLFDQHPEVLCCPWLHYTYSYLVTNFGDDETLDADVVRKTWPDKYYFNLLYNELDDDSAAFLDKTGADPTVLVDRAVVRRTFDDGLSGRTHITRKELVLLTYLAFARGVGRDIESVKYLLISDSISLRSETVDDGFSGRAVAAVVNDFPEAKIIHLVRDPRAGLASTNHQFVNSLGNMYGIHWGNYWRRFSRLLKHDFDWDSVFVFGFWLMYFSRTFEAAENVKAQYSDHFYTIKNEHLNLDFIPTIKSLCQWLDVSPFEPWLEKDYSPTVMGLPWKGGASGYSNKYQTNKYGPLRNDPDKVSSAITGPNVYVTERWKQRLSNDEIALIEYCLHREFQALEYPLQECVDGAGATKDFENVLWRPLQGELPTLKWIASGRHIGLGEILDRVFYTFSFPVFYVTARLVFRRIVRNGKIFAGRQGSKAID